MSSDAIAFSNGHCWPAAMLIRLAGWPAASGLTLMVAFAGSRSTAVNAVITFAVLAGGSASCS